jgi:DNA polymerase/3'-5' exonuclease PolX
MSSKKIVKIFKEMAEIYMILGDEFRAIAYLRVIRNINKSKDVLETLGVGKSIKEKILEIKKTGKLRYLEDLRKNPLLAKIKKLRKLKGFSKKKIILLIEKYNISSPKDIKKLNKEGKIKLNNSQLLGLKYANDLLRDIPRKEITLIGRLLRKIILEKIEIVGSYRRKKQFSGDIDILVISDISKILLKISESKDIKIVGTFMEGMQKFSGLIKTKYSPFVRQIDILSVKKENYIPALLYFTGSGLFNRKMRLIAKEKGYKLNEKELSYKGRKVKDIKSEREIFNILGIDYLPPEKRY